MIQGRLISSLFFVSSMMPLPAESGIHGIEVEDIDGSRRTLAELKGKVILIVNVASKCGFTYQYETLEALYQKYKDDGLVILGFPSNDFLGQEPGTNEKIKEFCTLNYGVTFPMYAKISVKGRNAHPLYRHLTSRKTNPGFSGRITWNFNKFLINGEGEVVGRFGSRDEPDSPKVVRAIENILAATKGNE